MDIKVLCGAVIGGDLLNTVLHLRFNNIKGLNIT